MIHILISERELRITVETCERLTVIGEVDYVTVGKVGYEIVKNLI